MSFWPSFYKKRFHRTGKLEVSIHAYIGTKGKNCLKNFWMWFATVPALSNWSHKTIQPMDFYWHWHSRAHRKLEKWSDHMCPSLTGWMKLSLIPLSLCVVSETLPASSSSSTSNLRRLQSQSTYSFWYLFLHMFHEKDRSMYVQYLVHVNLWCPSRRWNKNISSWFPWAQEWKLCQLSKGMHLHVVVFHESEGNQCLTQSFDPIHAW